LFILLQEKPFLYQHEIRIEKMELKKLRSVVSVKFLKQFSVKVKVEKWFP